MKLGHTRMATIETTFRKLLFNEVSTTYNSYTINQEQFYHVCVRIYHIQSKVKMIL